MTGDSLPTHVGVGQSTASDSFEAGRTAADRSIANLGTDRVDFCQVFAADSFRYEPLLRGIRDVIGTDAKLIGCSGARQFTGDRVTADGVVVSTIASDTIEVFTNMQTGLDESVTGTAREVTAPLPKTLEDYSYYSAIVLHDGLTGVGEKLSMIVQQQLGPHVEFAGGAASDNLTMNGTHVFCGDEIAEDAVAIALFASQSRPVITVEHGHEPISKPLEVTKSTGNVVHELDGRSAFEAWKDITRESAKDVFGMDIDEIREPGPELTKLLTAFEFGLNKGDGYKIRWPRVDSTETGDLIFAVDVPEGTVFRVMYGSPEKQIESARTAAREAVDAAGETAIAGAWVYDCVCREIILQDRFVDAVTAIAEEVDCPLTGFETYGELCVQMAQMSGYHNTTTVIMLIPE